MPPWLADLLKLLAASGALTLAVEVVRKWKGRIDRRAAEAATRATERSSEGELVKDISDGWAKLNESSSAFLARMQAQVEHLEGRVTGLQSQVSTLEAEMRVLRREKHDMANQLMAAEARAERAEAALRAEQEAHAGTRADCTRLTGRLEQVTGDLRQAKQLADARARVGSA